MKKVILDVQNTIFFRIFNEIVNVGIKSFGRNHLI